MSEIKALERIAACLVAIRAELGGIGFILLLMLLFKNMGGR